MTKDVIKARNVPMDLHRGSLIGSYFYRWAAGTLKSSLFRSSLGQVPEYNMLIRLLEST
jgi:hypothetical protein